jgi:DNA-binding XRE family transcriptional regulator
MNNNDKKTKLRMSRRRKLRKRRDQLLLLNASKKTLDQLERDGCLPKIVKEKLGR